MPKDALIAQFKEHVLAHNDATRYETLQGNNPLFMPFAKVPHFLSNEMDVELGQRELEKLPARRTDDVVSVAILTGEAYVLSRLPELAKHVDVVLLADINPHLHAHTAFLVRTMKNASTRTEFQQAYLDEAENPILRAQFKSTSIVTTSAQGERLNENHATVINVQMLAALLESMKQTLPGLCFLHSDERYQVCRQALLSMHVCNLCWDWLASQTAEQFMKRLGDMPVRFEFCHVSNVPDYDGNFPLRDLLKKDQRWYYQGHVTESLKNLLVHSPQALIQFSRDFRVTHHNHLHALTVKSLDEFSQLCHLRQREANTKVPHEHEFTPVFGKLQKVLSASQLFPSFEWIVTTRKEQPFILMMKTMEYFREREQALLVARYLKANGFGTVQLMREPAPTGENFFIILPDATHYLLQQTAAPATSASSSTTTTTPKFSTSSTTPS